ncbi:hypothetical protein GCM10027598_03250 [Amycolatopsis oliviviridis]|uniref:Uncharacterized protein n=1 Tax=Amycolatopsis oliviviridis TaxID=1471590 RepID=A0ABQ3LRB2_9PSEU|nr:hypothetical protein GCM10017790_36640 [Amycolatopsis oliviviridis]
MFLDEPLAVRASGPPAGEGTASRLGSLRGMAFPLAPVRAARPEMRGRTRDDD